MNNDVIKDPIQPGTAPQPANSNKTVLIIIIVIVVILFLLPMFVFFGLMMFAFSALEGLEYTPDERYITNDIVMTKDQSRTFRAIYMLNDTGMLSKNGISRQDCMNMYDVAEDYFNHDIDYENEFQWLPANYCKGDYANIAVESYRDYYVVYLSDDKTCVSYRVSSDHSTLENFTYGTDSTYCVEGIKAPIIDDGSLDEDEGDDEPEIPSLQTPSTPQTKTNAV